MKSTFTKILPGGSIAAMLLTGSAFAQTKSPETQARATEKDKNVEEVVVTGTLLRGIAPSSAQVISLGRDDAAATGALSTPQLLANIPQLTGFNSTPAISGANNTQVTINPVNLRGLPGTGGEGSTLELLDGHRIAGAGIKSTSPDPDFLPSSVIERIEVVPDGGSSIYGADAVGGVLNLITRKRFNGVQFDGRYGSADNYKQSDYGVTVGRDWGSGSAFVAYNRAQHDPLYGRDRDYVKNINWTTGLGAEANCAGNATLLTTGTQYIVSGATLAPGRNFCDRSGSRTFYPDEKRDSTFASFMQGLGDNITLDVRGYYTRRQDRSDEGPRASSATMSATSPFYRAAPGAPTPNQSQSVQMVFTPFGAQSIDSAVYETWGVTPSLTVDLPHEWQLRTVLSYGHTITTVRNPALNAVALGTAAALGQFNAYDVTANSPALLDSIGNWEIYGRAENELGNARAVFDGPLLRLAGGEIRGAFGVEYLHEAYKAMAGNSVPGLEKSTLREFPSHRHTNAAFAEVNVPIVGDKNRVAAVHALALSLSARYDDYSDFGNTTNPAIGLNYQPVEWVNFRGRWGKSFQAPSLADSAAADNTLLLLPSSTIQNPFQAPTAAQRNELIFQGGDANVQPQTAKTWSAGFDISPPVVPGLTLTGTYYHIKYNGLVSIPPVFIASQFFTQFTSLFVMSPTPAQVTAFINAGPNAAQVLAQLNNSGGPASVYALLDGRRRNLGNAEVAGVDLGGRYTHPMSFGSIYASLNGTYRVTSKQSSSPSAPLLSVLGTAARFRYTATLGATLGEHLRGQATLLYSDGFPVTPTAANSFQTQVSSFQTVNLFFGYDVNGTGLLGRDLSFTLSVNNVADHNPPLYQGTFPGGSLTTGYANGGTVGRLFQFGVSKKF